LDTVALAAHCGSNDGFVSKWYDQSGNSNDAAQGVTGQMPKIYDGTTGVVTENGKPAVQFSKASSYQLNTSTSFSLTDGLTATAVHKNGGSFEYVFLFTTNGAAGQSGFTNTTIRSEISGRQAPSGSYFAINNSGNPIADIMTARYDYANDTLSGNFQGVSKSATGLTDTATAVNVITLGFSTDGKMQECIFWGNLNNAVADIETAVANYYNITI
jgi:hypothetical protein